jgi:hypothetical protein
VIGSRRAACVLAGLLLTGCTLSGAGQKATQEFQWETLRQRQLMSPPLDKGSCHLQSSVDTSAKRQPKTVAIIGDGGGKVPTRTIPVATKENLEQTRFGGLQATIWTTDPGWRWVRH